MKTLLYLSALVGLITALCLPIMAQNPLLCGNANAPDWSCTQNPTTCLRAGNCSSGQATVNSWSCTWTDPNFGPESCTYNWTQCNGQCAGNTIQPALYRRPRQSALDGRPIPIWDGAKMLRSLAMAIVPKGVFSR